MVDFHCCDFCCADLVVNPGSCVFMKNRADQTQKGLCSCPGVFTYKADSLTGFQ